MSQGSLSVWTCWWISVSALCCSGLNNNPSLLKLGFAPLAHKAPFHLPFLPKLSMFSFAHFADVVSFWRLNMEIEPLRCFTQWVLFSYYLRSNHATISFLKKYLFGCGSYLGQVVLSLVVVHGLSCPEARGILVPRPGISFESLALEGEFLSTTPPGESPFSHSSLWKVFLSRRKLPFPCIHLTMLPPSFCLLFKIFILY